MRTVASANRVIRTWLYNLRLLRLLRTFSKVNKDIVRVPESSAIGLKIPITEIVIHYLEIQMQFNSIQSFKILRQMKDQVKQGYVSRLLLADKVTCDLLIYL